MAQRNDGTSPGKIWYGWQYTKGIINTAVKKGGGADIKKVAVYGAAAVGLGVAAVATVFIPFVPFVLPAVCTAGAAVSARNTTLKFKMVRNHPKFSQFIKNKEQDWLSSKARASLGARAKAFCKRSFGKASLPFTIAGKWLGFGAAGTGLALGTAGGLHLGGIIAIPAAVLAPIGTAATVVGLTAASGVIAATALCAVAIPAGIATAVLCRKATQKLKDEYVTHQAASRRAPALVSKMEPANSNNAPAPASNFNNAASETTALSQARQAAAAERARKRALDKQNAKRITF